MKEKDVKELVSNFMDTISVEVKDKNPEKSEKKSEILKEIIEEMMSSENYETERFSSLMLLTTPFIKKENIQLNLIAKVMTERKYDFIQSSLRIKSINNLQGYVNVGYKTSNDSSWESTYTCYFTYLAEIDNEFKRFLNYE